MSISYGGVPVHGQRLTLQQTSRKPNVSIPPGHTLVLYDPDAVQPSYIHWIATAKGDALAYKGPSPPPGTGTHHYTFALVKGSVQIPEERASVHAASLVKNPIATVQFTVDAPLR